MAGYVAAAALTLAACAPASADGASATSVVSASAEASCPVVSWAEEFTGSGHLAWKISLPVGGNPSGGNTLQPLVIGGVSVLAYNNGLYAVRRGDGRLLWRRVFPEAKTSVASFIGGMWQWRGSVIAQVGGDSSAAKLVSLNPATGAVRWTLSLGRQSLADAQALASDGMLVVLTAADRLEAADLTTGKLLWSRAYGDSAGPVAVGTVVIATKNHGSFGKWTRTITGFDARTGKVLWSRGNLPDEITVAAAPGGRVLVYQPYPSIPLKPDAKPFPVLALSAQTGRQLWQLTTGKQVTTVWAGPAGVVVATGIPGTVLVEDPGARLYLANPATGAVRWSAGGTHADPYTTALITSTDVVYVATTPATGTVIDRQLATGALRWKATISDAYGRFLVRPSGPNVGVIFPPASARKSPELLALDAVTGATRATVSLPDIVAGAPAVVGGDIVLQADSQPCVPPVVPGPGLPGRPG